jgi:hypothetical protein
MKKSLSTLILIAVFIALIIGCSRLGAPIGNVENNVPEETAMNNPVDEEELPATEEPAEENPMEEEPPIEEPETELPPDEGPYLDIPINASPSAEEKYDQEITAEIDLDGDGSIDEIILKTVKNPYYDEVLSYVLLVNGEEITYEGSMIDPLFHVVNISNKDSYLEIAVSEEGPSADFLTVFYRYKNGELTKLAEIQGFLGKYPGTDYVGDVQLDGNGRITTRTRGEVIQTWFYDDSYILTEDDELLNEEKDFYSFETEVKVLKELKTVTGPDDGTEAYVFQPGESATLLETDNREWVSIGNDSGEVFWFKINNYSEILGQDEKAYAYDYFEGLNMAD